MLRPLFDNVVLQKIKAETRTASGIVLNEAKEEPSIGVVLSVGPGKTVDGKLIPVSVKAGDKVVFKKYGTTEVKIDQEEYAIISEEDILAVVE